MTDKRISESDLVLPTLYVISTESQVTTSKLIPILERLLKPTGKDAEILKNRRDTHFSQKVRNLVSHRTLERLGYATYSKIGKSGAYTINENGKSFLQINKDALVWWSQKSRQFLVENKIKLNHTRRVILVPAIDLCRRLIV